jgi:HK97 gp10 family phage protein
VSLVLSLDDRNIKQKLATLPEHMIEWAEEVLLNRAHYMRDIAQVLVPVDTGSLRDSIRVERGGKGLHWREVRVRAGGYIVNPKSHRLVDYAVFVEKGTRKMDAQPFMKPAFDEVKADIAYLIKSLVVEKVKDM